MSQKLKKILIFLPVFVFLLGFLTSGANAAIRGDISISPNPVRVNDPVQIQINASDSKNSILVIDLYINGQFAGDGYDCTKGTNNPVKTCSAVFTKQFSAEGNYKISAGILDINGKSTDTPEMILMVTLTLTPPPPSSSSPKISAITPSPAPIGSPISVSGTNFCSNLGDFNLSLIAVIFDQTTVPGGMNISVPPKPMALGQEGSNCSVLKVVVPSALIQDNNVKVFVQNTKGVSAPIDLPLEKALPSGTEQQPSGKLEVNWPSSPMGTPLNDNSKLVDLIKYLYEWGISLGGFAAFIALLIAGFQYLTSAGNAGRMSDAMKRMQSAGLGLVLLFGSFIILNTINPQLTELKMPSFEAGSKSPSIEEPQEIKIPKEKCESATLSGGETPVTLSKGGEADNLSDVNSVEITGNCKLILFRLTGFRKNSDNDPETIFGKGSFDVKAMYGTTKFHSARLSDLTK